MSTTASESVAPSGKEKKPRRKLRIILWALGGVAGAVALFFLSLPMR